MDDRTFEHFENFDFEGNEHFQAGWKVISRLIDPEKMEMEYLRAKVFFYSKNIHQIDQQQYLLWRKQRSKQRGVRSKKLEDEQEDSPYSNSSQGNAYCVKDIPEGDSTCPVSSVTEERVSLAVDGSTCEPSSQAVSIDSKVEKTRTEVVSAVTEFTTVGKDQPILGDSTDDNHNVKKSELCFENSDMTKTGHAFAGLEKQSLRDHEDEQPSLSLMQLADLIQKNHPIPGIIQLEVKPTLTEPTPSAMPRKVKPWEINQQGTTDSDSILSLEDMHISCESADAV